MPRLAEIFAGGHAGHCQVERARRYNSFAGKVASIEQYVTGTTLDPYLVTGEQEQPLRRNLGADASDA